ncbi:hypothetical protein TTHERM_01068110 (macronuclear) [Tetrahymena thermophila SB210]|uniref:Uncharacterized protein n=1 Tax=Tetrahymena thermophila (strain SB210) TaxID=312017 RepID=Q22C99_TETTS|nr:hypothetical protein TTHERM_01068110 [Tetrahymena thermophila SB210]EAR82908.1 hypothetical protein TTHERM_01068110 [Tetrahymena thermophila SB210]|eukprot:XP_001030571.1 hypothetical protein TTHERM_01068110 [Tetrahymena thermophila SB210]
MRQQSPQQNSLNSSKFNSQDKASLKTVKMPETKQMSNKELFMQQNTPKPQNQDLYSPDISIKQINPSRQSKTQIESAAMSQNNIKLTSIKDLITEPSKKTIEARDQRQNFFRSNSNNNNNNNNNSIMMKGDDTIEKNIQRIIEERVQQLRQEFNQATDQQINNMLEKATYQIKQVDQIEQDMQNSKNELKRLLNFEQYLKNTVESLGDMKKNQIEQIVQKSIENQMQQHIRNSQQFVEDMNKYKKQFDQILQGQLAYVQEAHKKYILDDADNKQFSERFKQQFEEFQKQIASNYLAMVEKLTDYTQQVEEKALHLDSKYMGQLRSLRDDLSKQIDDGMKQLKTHITSSENQLNQKVEIDQFKGLLDEYFYQTYQKYHSQIEELKEIFQKISGRDDFAKFSDDKMKELTQKFEKDLKNQHEQQMNLLKRQSEKIVELQEKLAATQRQYKVADNKVQRMFKVSGRNLGIQETYSGLQLLDNSQLVKDKYEILFEKSQQVFQEMQNTISQLQKENYELKQNTKNQNAKKQVKKLKFKPSQLKEELMNLPKEQNKQKNLNRKPSIQSYINQQHSRNPSQENDQFKRNSQVFSNQLAISPIASVKSSQVEMQFQTQENILSLPLFPVNNGDPLQLRQSSKEKIPLVLGSQENPISLFGSRDNNNKKDQENNQKTGRFNDDSKNEESQNNKPSLVSPYLRNTTGNNEKLFNDPKKINKEETEKSNQKNDVNNLFRSQEIKFEIEKIPELQEEVIQRELYLEDLQQEKRKNQFQLFDSKQPTHQFQLFDDKKNPSHNLFEDNKRNSLSPSSHSNHTQQVLPTQPYMVSSQNNNASIITFNPLSNSQAIPTQPAMQTQIIPVQSQFQQPQIIQNIHAQQQIQPQIFQALPPQQSQIIPTQQNSIVNSQLFPIQPQQVLVQNVIEPAAQQNIPINQIQMQQNNNILGQTIPSNTQQTYNRQNTPERTVQALNIASPEEIQQNSHQKPQDNENTQFLMQRPSLSPKTQNYSQSNIQINGQNPQATMLSSAQDKNLNQNSPMFKNQQHFNTIDVPDRYNSNKLTNDKDDLDQTKKLLVEREYLLNQQKEIIKQFYTLEAKSSQSRNQRTKSTDIPSADTFKQPEDSGNMPDDYFSLNPQFQQSQNNNLSQNKNQLNQSNNANNKSISRITKSHNDSNLEVQEIVSTLENATSPNNQQNKFLFSPLDPKNLFPLQSKEQKDHLYNLQQLSINPYSKSNEKLKQNSNQQNDNQSGQLSNYDSQQQSSKKKRNKIFINRNNLPPAQFFSNPIQIQNQNQTKNQFESNQNQQTKQKTMNPPLFNQQPKKELFPNLSSRNSQFTQSMNQIQNNRKNMTSPMNQESQSDQFTFKPSQSHQSIGSNQRNLDSQAMRYQNYQMQTPISHNNAIQMNDLEDFNEDEIMMYSPTNQKPSYNQRKYLFQSDNDSNFDEDFFFYPDHTSAASKKLASPISPINFSASQHRSNNQKQRINQREMIINNQQQILSYQNNNSHNNSNSQPTPPKRMTIEDEQIYEKLIKRRLLYNNKTENTKDKKLKVRKESDGKLKDIYNKYIYDEKGNPILFSSAAITYLVNSNLIELI